MQNLLLDGARVLKVPAIFVQFITKVYSEAGWVIHRARFIEDDGCDTLTFNEKGVK